MLKVVFVLPCSGECFVSGSLCAGTVLLGLRLRRPLPSACRLPAKRRRVPVAYFFSCPGWCASQQKCGGECAPRRREQCDPNNMARVKATAARGREGTRASSARLVYVSMIEAAILNLIGLWGDSCLHITDLFLAKDSDYYFFRW